MLIGIDASRANTKQKTGVEWYSYNLINALKKIDKDNQYILYSQDKLNDELNILPDNFKSKILKWPFKKFWTQIRLSISASFNRVNVLFIPAGIIPIMPIKHYKIVTTIHDVAFLEYPEYFSKKEIFLQKLGLKLAVLMSKKIITISNFSKEQIIKYTKCNPNKIHVAHLGYDKEKFKPITDNDLKQKVKEKYKFPDKFLLYVGRIEEKKNILNQIEAFQMFRKEYPEYYFVLIGKHGYGYENIKKVLEEKKLNENVIELGWVDDFDRIVILNMCDLFMYVTNYEGFGLPMLEAQACGIPLVTASSTCQYEITNDSALYSLPDDIEKIYQNIIEIIENENNIRNILIDEGFENVLNFSWEKCATETLNAIETLKE